MGNGIKDMVNRQITVWRKFTNNMTKCLHII